MFGSEILDLAIGLSMMFLVLSLVCSSMREAVETVMKHRARDLERGIREMFGEVQGKDLVALFYNSPLINGLFRGDYDPKNTGNLPSYIPAKTFSLAVMDLLWPAAQHGQTPANAADMVNDFKSAVTQVAGNSNLGRALMPLVESAHGDIKQVRTNIEDWYNSAMDRVSGWYKRRTQIIIGALALTVSALMNADALAIARYLNTEQTTRSVLIARAQSAVEQKSLPAGPEVPEMLDPLRWIEQQGGVPLGWVVRPRTGQSPAEFDQDWRRPPQSLDGWIYKILGLLFTTFAISLGAPFWFDVLNRIMVIRSTIKPSEKSPEEKSKA